METTLQDASRRAEVGGFTRKSSGLVRELTLADAAGFGILGSGGLFAFVFLFPGPQFASPGISIPLLLVLTLLFATIVYFVYAALGSAMPRAGGDYLYESRSLHAIVGFTVPWACQLLFWLAFPTAGAFVVGTFGLVPIAEKIGLDGVAAWLVTKWGTFVVAATVVVLCWILNTLGLRVYRGIQRWVLIPLTLIATATIIILLLVNLGTDFSEKFNTFHNGDITTASVAAAAAKAGYQKPSFDLGNTLIWVAVLGAYIPYTMYSAQGLLGEVKQASSLRRLFLAFLLPGAFVALIMLALPWALLSSIAGSNFIDEYAWAFGSGGIAPSYSPNFSVFLSMLSDSWLVTILVSLGFVAGGFGIANVVFVNAARVMMAMGLDGMLPRFFSDVHPRTHTPVKSLTLWSALALVVAAIFSFKPDWQTTVLLGGAITSVLVVGVSCLAGALLPYRARGIYESAPVSQYRLGGIPLVTIVGILGAACVAGLIVCALTLDELALTDAGSRAVIAAAFATGILVYFGWRAARRAQGIDTSLALREVPPE
ncbi:MAG TPA: APC family permease [Thermoleophilaceae bacterium]|jgi:amino acid transporter